MTDQITEPQPATEQPEPAEPQTQPPEAETEEEISKPGKEAARYRVRLRETEAERDQLRALVETFQRSDAERAVADILHRPAGLWAAGTRLADLLDDQGRVDPDKAVAAAKAALEQVGLAPKRRRTPAPDPSQGRGSTPATGSAWKEAFRRNE